MRPERPLGGDTHHARSDYDIRLPAEDRRNECLRLPGVLTPIRLHVHQHHIIRRLIEHRQTRRPIPALGDRHHARPRFPRHSRGFIGRPIVGDHNLRENARG